MKKNNDNILVAKQMMRWFVLIALFMAGCEDSSTTIEPQRKDETPPTADKPMQSPPVAVSGKEGFCNLGRVLVDGHYFVTFNIENPAPTPLTVEKVRSNCACIIVKETPKRIEPNGSEKLVIDYISPPLYQPYVSHIMLVTDHPDRRLISLHIKATAAKK